MYISWQSFSTSWTLVLSTVHKRKAKKHHHLLKDRFHHGALNCLWRRLGSTAAWTPPNSGEIKPGTKSFPPNLKETSETTDMELIQGKLILMKQRSRTSTMCVTKTAKFQRSCFGTSAFILQFVFLTRKVDDPSECALGNKGLSNHLCNRVYQQTKTACM